MHQASKGIVFDNGMPFRGRLLEAFCRNLGIQLIHTAPQHPQTNGKLERAFRDDMPEFYRQQAIWELEALRCTLPAYVHRIGKCIFPIPKALIHQG